MLKQIGHTDATIEMFNYSQYGLSTVERRDLANHWDMLLDPSMREVIMTVSRKPSADAPGVPIPDDWRAALRETETYWSGKVPATDSVARDQDMLVNSEILLERLNRAVDRLQADVTERDRMLREQEDHLQGEIQRRDQLMVELNGRLQREINIRDQMLSELRATWESSLSFKTGRLLSRLTGKG
jgi:hypothetical protein